MPERYDLVVIGGGPAGYVGAIRAAQLGRKVACIEMDRAGGTCLNWGCIPSKSLLRNAELYRLLKDRAGDFGLRFEGLSFEWSGIMGRSRKVADRLSGGIGYLFRKNRVDYLAGKAELTEPGRVTAALADGSRRSLEADRILVSTGVRPRPLPGLAFDGKRVIGSKEALVLTAPPASMVIVGAGAIGVEFAYFYNAFGTRVTLLEMMPHLLPVEDEEVSQALARSFSRQGIEVHTSTRVDEGVASQHGVQVSFGGETTGRVEAEVVLVAVGVDALLPPGLELETDRGFIKVDGNYRTSIEGVYAAGDVIGPPWLAHVASYQAVQAVEGLFANGKPRPLPHYPSCTYCNPQVASVGLTERAARESGEPCRVGRFPFRANGKALAVGESEGFVKLIFGEADGELLGAHLIGSEATELIGELGLAMTLGATFEDIEATIQAHPTLGEAVHEAGAAAFGRAIHL
ncbi:MAG: dihydrolipoyl dehydrogenase [Acidobacteriota bacterium]|nr:dihydrolipoyl dehydrogenase [Acidobacteriota bacterium]MDE2963781.1 dihydrolipoyl dehydrogenase [Acidobacteriota bacterium]